MVMSLKFHENKSTQKLDQITPKMCFAVVFCMQSDTVECHMCNRIIYKYFIDHLPLFRSISFIFSVWCTHISDIFASYLIFLTPCNVCARCFQKKNKIHHTDFLTRMLIIHLNITQHSHIILLTICRSLSWVKPLNNKSAQFHSRIEMIRLINVDG